MPSTQNDNRQNNDKAGIYKPDIYKPDIYKLGVIGAPISHSQSPHIHQQFAAQFGFNIDYQKYNVEAADLDLFLSEFFAAGGDGLNVTLPHKIETAKWATQLTERASLTQSVNTLYRNGDGEIAGDTTDGRGLLADLERHHIALNNRRLLLLGAGGAACSIIYDLLKAGANLTLWNRSPGKAEKLVERFKKVGNISLYSHPVQPELVISSLTEPGAEASEIIKSNVSQSCDGYDLNYGKRSQALHSLFVALGGKRFVSGEGMLIAQAAKSFEIWTGHSPAIDSVSLLE